MTSHRPFLEVENSAITQYLDCHFGNLIDALSICQDEDAVQFALKCLASNAGFEHFAYVELRPAGHRVCSTYPIGWQERYVTQNYITLDPAAIQAGRTMRPVPWSYADNHRDDDKTRLFFEEARKFGIASGIILPIRGGFGTTVLLALATAREVKGEISIRDSAYAATAVAFVHSCFLRLSKRKLGANDLPLSPRELHCVAWAAMGKTKAETGSMLGISEKTVRFYLERVREKLNATNITHAVRIGTKRDLF